MELSNLRIRKSWLFTHTKLVQRYLLIAFLLLMAWTPQAFAFTLSCTISTSPPVSATVNPSTAQGFTVLLQETGGGGPCTPTNLTFSVISDTTGGVVLPATITGATFNFTGNPQGFSVTAGPTGGGSAVIQVNCSSCFGGTTSVQFTLNTNNVYAFTATSPTSVTTNQSKPFTLSTNLQLNGSPAGSPYQTDFFNVTGGSSLGTVVNSAAGDASVTTTLFTSGTRNVEGRVLCPTALPNCPPPVVPFTVIVEPVVMTAVSANAVGITAGGNTTMTARYGSTNTVVNTGYPITWSISASPTGGNGVLSGATNTNASGQTQANFTATVPGVYTVTASSGDTWSSDPTESFTITVTAIVRTLVVSSGDAQSAPTSTALPAPLVALAQDNGVNAPGITVNWTTTGGTLSAASSVTTAGGLASIGLTLPATPGPVTITGTRADDGTAIATFTATATLTRTLSVSSGNAQSAPTSTALPAPLVAHAQDNGVNAPGITVNWTTTGGTLSAASSITSATGLASIGLTLPATPGPVTITGTRADDGTAIATFTATATLTRTLSVSSGNAQSAPTSTALPAPLVAHAQDNGVNAPGITVNWTTTGGTLSAASSITSATGLASIGLTLPATPGPVTITGTRADDGTAIATFTATATLTRTLTVSSGNAQSAPTSTALPAPLVALAQDNGVNKPGVTVNWTTTGGTLSAASSITSATGLASIGLTLPGTPGLVTITGTRADDGTAIATFTATATLTRTLSVSSGNAQSAPTSTALPAPLVAHAQDNGVNAPGITVNWTTTGGTLSAASSVTTAGGLASIGLTLPATPGPVTITGTRADDGTAIATFTATATLVRTLTITSGNGQNAAPGSPLPAPLVVNAKNNGISVPGVTINWTITPGSTLGTASNITSATGAASNTATLSTTPGSVTITASRQDDPTVSVTFTANGVRLAGIPGLQPNQERLAVALDNICANLNSLTSPTASQSDFIDRCQELADNAASNPGDVITALDELLPDSQAAMARASMLTASRQFENINARIAALRSGTQGSSFDGLALNGANGSISLGSLAKGFAADNNANEVGSEFQRWGFFASGTIGTGDANATTGTPGFDFDINGLTVGVDYRHSDKFIFGAAAGYTSQDTDLAPGQGGVDATGYTLSAYGTFFKSNSWYTDAVITLGKNNYDLVRQINYTIPDGMGGFTNVDQTARSDSGGDLMSMGITFGRDFNKGGWSIGPYGRLLYTRLNFDRIEETLVDTGPGAGLALIVEERSLDSLASVIGAKFTRAFSTSWGVLTPHFQLEWEHEFNSDPGAATARFVNDPTGTEIILTDEPYDADFFRIGLGLSAIMSKGRSAFIYYDKALGRDGISQDNLAVGFRMEF